MNWKCRVALAVGALAAAAIVVAFAWCDLDLDAPNEALCPQGDALRTARMLEKAEATYIRARDAGEECENLTQVELDRAEATKHFEVANTYAAASPASPAPSEAIQENSRRAIDAFAEGLELDPFESSANTGLALELKKGVVDIEVRCETAANFVDAGLLSMASIALSKGLEEGNPSCEDTVEELRSALTVASTHLRSAKGKSDVDAEREAYGAALLTNANLTAAQTGLEGTLDDDSCLDEIGDWLAGVPDTLKTGLAWLIPLAIGFLLLLLAIWILVRESSARWRWARRLFEGWGKHPGFSFLYNAAVPDIEVKPFGGKGEDDLEGAGFSSLLAAEMARQVGREPAFPFDRIVKGEAPDSGTSESVVELLNEIPATKPLGSVLKLVSKLFRRRTILLTGQLTPPSDEGAGVLLSVEGSRRDLNETTTIRERTYDPEPGEKGSSRWLRLIPAASVWARWHLQAAQDPTEKLQTDTWRADALFQSAQAWQLKGDRARAEALYTGALERDPGLLPASHNLAVLENRNRRYAHARKREEAVRAALKSTAKKGTVAAELTKHWPTLDTASLYTLMLALVYPEIDEEAASGDADLELAVAKGRKLVSTLAHELEPTAENRERKEEEAKNDRTIAEQLELAEMPSVVVLASLAVRLEKDQQAKAVECAVSEGAGVVRIWRHQLREKVGEQAPWRLIHGYVLKQRNLSTRTHYNLACYFTTLSQLVEGDEEKRKELRTNCQDLALESLEAALVGGKLIDWCQKDPSLAPLWGARKTDLTKILKARTIAPHTDDEKPPEKDKGDSGAGDANSLSGRLARLEERGRKRFGQ